MVTSSKMVLCETCNVWVKAQGLGTHRRQKHQILQNRTPMCAGEKSTSLLNEIKHEIDNLKRLSNTSTGREENIENVMSKYLNNRQQVDQTGLVEQINTLNNQMEKLLNRIQNIENILRF